MGSPNLFRVLRDGLLHSEGRITRSYGVILMGERRTEERHDPVAHNPVHRAFITMDGLDHAFDHRVEKLLSVLGIAVSK